jgi:hypothetical protein
MNGSRSFAARLLTVVAALSLLLQSALPVADAFAPPPFWQVRLTRTR